MCVYVCETVFEFLSPSRSHLFIFKSEKIFSQFFFSPSTLLHIDKNVCEWRWHGANLLSSLLEEQIKGTPRSKCWSGLGIPTLNRATHLLKAYD